MEIRKELKNRIINATEEDAEKIVEEVVAEAEAIATVKTDAIFKKSILPRRKKYAETEVVASELGMTLQQVREFNAYSDGYNDRAKEIEERMAGNDVPVQTGDIVLDVPAEAEGVEAEKIKKAEPEILVEPEVVPVPEELPAEEVV